MTSKSKDYSDNLVNSFKRLFFTPEIEKRIREKTITPDFELRAGQVIFYPNGAQPLVRLNKEVSANAKVKKVEIENGEKREVIVKITLNEKKIRKLWTRDIHFYK